MRARIFVTLKPGVLDPQGQAIQGALGALGFAGVASVRQGKVFDIELSDGQDAEARAEGYVRQAAGQYGDRGLPGRACLSAEQRIARRS